jgi:hypothetical protein
LCGERFRRAFWKISYTGEYAMTIYEVADRQNLLGEKDTWHPCSLQSLPQKRFVEIAGKILRREHHLLNHRSSRDDRLSEMES